MGKEDVLLDNILDSILVSLDAQVENQCDLIIRIMDSNRSLSRALEIQKRLLGMSSRLSERASLCTLQMSSPVSATTHPPKTFSSIASAMQSSASSPALLAPNDSKEEESTRANNNVSEECEDDDVVVLIETDENDRHSSLRSRTDSTESLNEAEWSRRSSERGRVPRSGANSSKFVDARNSAPAQLALRRSMSWRQSSVMSGSLTAKTIRRMKNATIASAWRQWVCVALIESGRRPNSSLGARRGKKYYCGSSCCCLFSPLSPFFIIWSLVLVASLIWILVMLPLEVAYLDDRFLKEGSPIMVVNRCMDALFILDLWVNFHTGYFDENEDLVMEPAKIAQRYIQSWFTLDFVSSMPPVVEVLTLAIVRGSRSSSTSSIKSAKVLKIGRIFKAFKMLRLSKVAKLTDAQSPFIDKIEDFASTSYSKFLGKIFFILFFSFALAHILGCCMAMSGDGWFEAYNRDNPDSNAGEWSWQRRYTLGLYWAFATMSTVGYGDVAPASDNERVYGIVAVVVGVSFYSYIVASVASIVTANDAKSAVYYEKMDAISSWIAHHRLNRELRHRIRLHFRQHYTARTALNEKEILENLSPALADDVTTCLLADIVRAHPLFAALPEGTMWKVLLICKREHARPGQTIISHGQLTSSLFILTNGHADCELVEARDPSTPTERHVVHFSVGPGSSFGELAVLGLYQKSLVTVNVRTRSDFVRIQQDALLKAFRSMPEVLSKMRTIAVSAQGGCRIVHP
ncbi:hypothetical protein CTAYLR_000332 [Chrysophaeum taylorii]|uniref:Cyclic nucleotide-binding domain-containing protein n=1 Tax=Chrysophaeum taylorii TaxID=2483200 RepID=A0AAD7XMB2_9STRA|nr:hypothetical protein CTAYLR_000332 [Chrysophaeum taylorii]